MKKFLLFALLICSVFQYGTAQIWSDNFDDQDISDWTLYDVDGDGNNWFSYSFGFDGTYCISSASWSGGVILNPTNYITSPAIDLRNETGAVAIDWKAYAQDQAWPREKYKVVVTEAPLQAAIDVGDNIFEETLTATGSNVWAERTADLSAYAGKTIYVTFVHFESSDWFQVNIDDVSVYVPASDDAGITAAVAPSNDGGCTFTDAENPTMTIFNFGGNAITGFDVSYSVNGGAAVVETVMDVVDPATSFDYTFNTPFDASALGEYTIDFSTSLNGDSNMDNDNYSSSFRHSDAVMTVHAQTDVSGPHAWEVVDNSTGEVVASHGSYSWDEEFFDDVCIYSDRCYSFNYAGAMGPGAYLEVLINGNPVAGDTDGNGVPATLSVPALGGGCAANEASLLALTGQTYHEINTDASITGVLRNFGSAPISMIEMSYSVDGGAAVVETFSGLDVLSGGTYEFSFSTPVSISDLTEYDVDVNIMTVNGEMDGDAANNNASGQLVAISYIPTKRTVCEEATGTWCTWCPRGAVLLNRMIETFGDDFIGIAVHNGDPMVNQDYDNGLNTLIAGYPSLVLDRVILDADPGGISDAQIARIEGDINSRLNTIAPMSVDLDVNYTGDGNMTIDVSSEFVAPVSGAMRYAVAITEDGVTGTSSGYAQVNQYSGGAQGPMDGYENLPSPVPADQMVYDHVAREILGGFGGIINSIPSDNARGDVINYSFDYQVADLSKLPNMHVVAMVIDRVSGAIVNANSTSLFTTGIEDVLFDDDKVRVFPNPSAGQSFVEITLDQSEEVQMSVFNTTGQMVAQRNYGELSGKMVLPFEAQNLENGMYYINLQIGDKIITKKLILAK